MFKMTCSSYSLITAMECKIITLMPYKDNKFLTMQQYYISLLVMLALSIKIHTYYQIRFEPHFSTTNKKQNGTKIISMQKLMTKKEIHTAAKWFEMTYNYPLANTKSGSRDTAKLSREESKGYLCCFLFSKVRSPPYCFCCITIDFCL